MSDFICVYELDRNYWNLKPYTSFLVRSLLNDSLTGLEPYISVITNVVVNDETCRRHNEEAETALGEAWAAAST